MSQLLSVRGGRRLEGEGAVQGAKNSVLPILAATLLARGQVALLGCPRLRDVDASIRILRHLGCDAHWEADALAVDTTALRRCEISDVLMREMRSSAIFLGAILARCGQADLSYPGGCELGPRPIDLHLAGLRDLGAEIREEGGFLHCRADRLRGREVVLRMPSVGATENLMLAACGAAGLTRICNAAREPEIVDLQGFLQALGARVTGAGTEEILVSGGLPLHPGTYRVMPDRIVTATYLCAVASAGGQGVLQGARGDHVEPVTAALSAAGCRVRGIPEGLQIARDGPLRGIGALQTGPYPAFPTDAQPLLAAALAGGTGETAITETIFDHRFRYAQGLEALGVRIDHVISIEIEDAVIETRMSGRRVCSACGASYHIAANPPKTEGTCDLCGGELMVRQDDTPETVRRRLAVYHQQTEALKDFYQKLGKLRLVEGNQPIEDANRAILGAIGA